MELVGGVVPRRAVTLTVFTDVDDAVGVGLDADREDVAHHSLTLVEAVDVIRRIVCVAATAPAEVEVEEVIVVVAVANEGMAAFTIGARIIDWMRKVEFCSQHGVPSLVLIAVLLAVFGAAVAEIGAQGGFHIL